jgi:polysaccharide export outer membrane protein
MTFARSIFFFLLLAGWSGLSPAVAQESGTTPSPGVPAPTRIPGAVPLLDAPVDRAEYALGPGDVVDIAVFGNLSRLVNVTVAPEGTLLIPEVGVVRVLGLDLEEAEARVRELIYRYYRNVDVALSLSQMRSFKVFVLGNVPGPGVRIANAATRVSELVQQVPSPGAAPRNILLRRASGDTLRVDLVRFLQAGDLSANPTLRDGDVVVVPTIEQTVEVYGRVRFPGPYEYRGDESLADLLALANGGLEFPPNAADTVQLTRFTNQEQRAFFALPRSEAVGVEGQSVPLEPFDAIYVAEFSNYKRQRVATVSGEVRRPGTYPIRPDITTIRDLVALAGGFTPDASLVNATLRRRAEGLDSRGVRQLENIPAEALSREERELVEIRARGHQTNVVVDFQELFAEGVDVYNQTLESGDVLFVPRRRDEVVVLGAVSQPGIVQFTPGRGIDYFVGLAGGYSSRADRGDVMVVKAKLDTRIVARDVPRIEPGDQIVVPFKERRTFLERVQVAQGILGALSGFVFTVMALDRLFD